ncbi:FimB/Mfa2 family fimbrial subunit [uncultured Parabacteroides sp.]|uniref:FimB/Mfa2 family fimbrial subunit n=1 Tax=uncultured Parabacteroides sp. TaxID=512312 RepID=UPI00262AFBD9|nr:FimB/Mfa2 family fimbrial subunit [uncultured Parabacteroides sp.]
MQKKRFFYTTRKLLVYAAIAGGLNACDWIRDDSLPPCEYRLRFVYDYNMKFADAFQHEVDQVTLFLCDQQGTFIESRHIEGDELKANNVRLDLAPGTYYLVSWAGLDKQTYTPPQLTPGSSTIQDIRVRTLRNTDNTQPNELHPLWHGLDTLVVTGTEHQEKVIGLDKDTNKLRFVLQNVKGDNMDVNDFTFRIIADNGYMEYDNSLLSDPKITYLPYYTENVEISADPDPDTTVSDQLVAVAEMNTMRLMADKNYRLIVRHKKFENDVLNINLNTYLLLSKMEGHKISAQEYLDRQDEYSIIFFLTPIECPDCPDPEPDPEPDPDPDPEPDPDPDPTPPVIGYDCYVIQVKDWVIRLNQVDL